MKLPQPKSTLERAELISRLQYLGQMASTETALFHHVAAAKSGLTVTDSKTMSALMQEGPMTAGQLAARLCLTTGAVTSVIDRLEQAGCAHRVADPSDRRKVIVRVDEERVAQIAGTYSSVASAFARLLSQYSVGELQFLAEYYEATIEIMKDEVAKASGGTNDLSAAC